MIVCKELSDLFPELIAQLPNQFDTHDLIALLNRLYPTRYQVAVNYYSHLASPEGQVDSQIGRCLGASFSHLVEKVGDQTGRNILGSRSSAAIWRKIG